MENAQNMIDDFLRKASLHRLVPLIREMPGDLDTPLGCYMKLKGAYPGSPSFLLETAESGKMSGRYSIIGIDPLFTFASRGTRVSMRGVMESERTSDDPFRELRNALARLGAAPISTAAGFSGGLVGYVGYDTVRFFENLHDEKAADMDMPDMFFTFPEKLVIVDSFTGNRTLVQFVHTGSRENPVSAYRRGTALLDGLTRAVERPVPRTAPAALTVSEPKSLVSREDFEDAVRRIKEYIVAGDVIQVVLSRRFSCAAEGDSLSLYRALRRINPSPYMFLLDLVDHSLIGSSPETLVRVEGGRMELKPIAGTRRRGRDVGEDHKLERELLADEKERAEHVMLVDLARNDAGRAARPGTVEVRDLMSVDRFSHVMHIVSTVQAEIADGLDAFDVFRAAFPAGTVTGAPKVRAMEIIDELEKHRRGFYAGAVGYFAVNGDMDFCITIRTMLKKDGFVYFQAGAGIVADSVPHREYEETLFKSQALVNALTGRNEGGTGNASYDR